MTTTTKIRIPLIIFLILYIAYHVSGYFEKIDVQRARNQVLAQTSDQGTVTIFIGKKLNNALIQNGTQAVKKGDVIVLSTNHPIVYKRIWHMPVMEITLVDILCFSLPGKKGKYWLEEDQPTAFKIKEDGKLRFSLCYPDTLTDFDIGERLPNGEIKKSIIKLKLERKKTFPRHYAQPRQLVRLNSLAGTVLPSLEVQNKYPDFDLDKEIKIQ